MKKIIIVLIFPSFLSSCLNTFKPGESIEVKHEHRVSTDSITTVSFEMPEGFKLVAPYLDHSFEDVRFVALETNKECIIGEIYKIEVYKDLIYIADQITDAVYVFDMEGRFKWALNKKGRGPGEYALLADFAIDRFKDELIVYSFYPLKVIRYSLTGDYIAEFEMKAFMSTLYPVDDGRYAIELGYRDNSRFFNHRFQLLIIDTLGNYVGSHLHYDQPIGIKVSGDKLFHNFNGKTYYNPVFNDTIYRVDGNTITPVYAIDFGKDAFNGNYLKRSIDELQEYFNKGEYAKGIYYQTNDLLFFIGSTKYFMSYAIYSKKSGKTMAVNYLPFEQHYQLDFPIGSTDEYIISRITPDYLVGLRKNLKERGITSVNRHLQEIIDHTDEFDNPVLVFFKLEF